MNDKTALRRHLKRRLRHKPDADIFGQSEAICTYLTQKTFWRETKTLMVTFPLAKEVDLTYITVVALRVGKIVTVPEVDWETGAMHPRRIHTLNPRVDTGRGGVRQPKDGEFIDPQDLDLVVTPGLGFDEHCGRLGRGGGYYDRFFAQNLKAIRCGVAFEDQIVENLPLDDHDYRMDLIMTPQRVIASADSQL